MLARDGLRVAVKIRPFHGHRDGKEDPGEYIEHIEFACQQDNGADAALAYKALHLVFRQILEDDAWK